MTFFIKHANFIKWASLSVGVIGFILRVIYGELNEGLVERGLTGETRMDGSSFGYFMIAINILSLVSFVIFNGLSKKKNR